MKANYIVTVLNQGEPMEAFHFGKTEKQIRKQYKLEDIIILSIKKIN